MFSYQIRIRRIANPNIKIKAVASLIVDDVMSIEGFKVINGSKGLFVSVPNHKGTIMEDGVKVDKYFDDVRFLGEEGSSLSQEIKDSILQAYNASGSSSDSNSRNKAAAAHVKAATKKTPEDTETSTPELPPKKTPDRTRKPLWNFT